MFQSEPITLYITDVCLSALGPVFIFVGISWTYPFYCLSSSCSPYLPLLVYVLVLVQCLAQWMEIDLYTVSFLNAMGKKDFTSYGERGEKKPWTTVKVYIEYVTKN